MSYPVTSRTPNLDTTEEIIQATLDIVDIRTTLERRSSMIIDIVAIIFILIAVSIRLVSGDKNKPAIFTHRSSDEIQQEFIGNNYLPLCRNCYKRY